MIVFFRGNLIIEILLFLRHPKEQTKPKKKQLYDYDNVISDSKCSII